MQRVEQQAQDKNNNPRPSFLCIPAELRLHIYNYHLKKLARDHLPVPTPEFSKTPDALLQTCRMICDESLPVLLDVIEVVKDGLQQKLADLYAREETSNDVFSCWIAQIGVQSRLNDCEYVIKSLQQYG